MSTKPTATYGSKRPANYVAKKLYFDWVELESYKSMAEYLGRDVESLMHNIITQGMHQLEQQILTAIREEQAAREPISE